MAAKLRDSLEWLLMVAMIFGGGAIARAESDAAADEQPTGKIVRIGPVDSGKIAIEDNSSDVVGQTAPAKHWIGILCGPVSEELRAQVELPEDHGLLVRQVVPGSPADKAGVKPFDILLTANEEQLADASQLTDLVRTQGASGEKISLDVLRRGEHHTIVLAPEARPDVPAAGSRGQAILTPGPQAWQLGPRDPLTYGFGGMPGPRTMPGFGLNQMPSGVSVSIKKQQGGPAHIKVQRGNDTWDIVGDDPSSLAQLPEDLRPFVEQMLASAQSGQLPSMSPMQMPRMSGRGGPAGFRPGELQQRLDLMQQQLEELQQRMRNDIDAMDEEGAPIDEDAAAEAN
jgi:hypothetical protein